MDAGKDQIDKKEAENEVKVKAKIVKKLKMRSEKAY
jgi:hypothetical protein